MLDKIPNAEEMTSLIGQSLYDIWNKLCALIDEKYDMECLWDKGGKAWTYEYKYRRGGKTLCALYAILHSSESHEGNTDEIVLFSVSLFM